jgi:hypothetical protein
VCLTLPHIGYSVAALWQLNKVAFWHDRALARLETAEPAEDEGLAGTSEARSGFSYEERQAGADSVALRRDEGSPQTGF